MEIPKAFMERRTIASSLILILGTLSVYGQGYQRLFDNARALLKAKKFDEALQEANRALQLDRSQWAAYFVAGGALVGLKRQADAISYFQAALTRAPEPAKPTVNEAIAACHEILANRRQPPLASYSPPQYDPDKNSLPLQKRAKENGETMSCNKALNGAFNAANRALQAKNYLAAVDSFNEAAAIDANQPAVWALLADAEMRLAKTQTGADQQASLDQATIAFRKALQLKPRDPGYRNNYALALASSKKFDEARAELQKAAQLDHRNTGRYFYNLGALLTITGQIEPACQAFDMALHAEPNYADAQYQHGICLVSKATKRPDGRVVSPDGTAEAFQKYLALQPTGPYAQSAKDLLAAIGAH